MQPSLPNPQPESPKNPLIISVDTPSDSFIKMAEAEGLKSIPIAQDILGNWCEGHAEAFARPTFC